MNAFKEAPFPPARRSVEPEKEGVVSKETKFQRSSTTRSWAEAGHPSLRETLRREVEKTRREAEIVEFANAAVDDLFRQYGVPRRAADLRQVHIVSSETTTGPFVNSSTGDVVLPRLPENAGLLLAEQTYHELLHQATIAPATATRGLGQVGLERATPEGRIVLHDLNEAVVAELEKSFYSTHLINEQLFADEIDVIDGARREIRKGPQAQRWMADEISAAVPGKGGLLDLKQFSYPFGRKALHQFVEEISGAGQTRLDRGKVFDAFVRALLTGELDPLKDLIEARLGGGSWDRLEQLALRDFLRSLRQQHHSEQTSVPAQLQIS